MEQLRKTSRRDRITHSPPSVSLSLSLSLFLSLSPDSSSHSNFWRGARAGREHPQAARLLAVAVRSIDGFRLTQYVPYSEEKQRERERERERERVLLPLTEISLIPAYTYDSSYALLYIVHTKNIRASGCRRAPRWSLAGAAVARATHGTCTATHTVSFDNPRSCTT